MEILERNDIKTADPEVWAAIQGEEQRQKDNLELIASENYASRAVREAMGCVMTNKYAEGYPGRRYYGGCEWVDVAERLAIGVQSHVNLRVHSTPWNQAVSDLRDADVIVGCMDTYAQRSDLESFARRYLIPYIDIGMDVHPVGDHFAISGQVALSMPGHACLKCMASITDDDVAKENDGAAGGRPQVVWPNGLLASAAIGILIELVTPWFSQGPKAALLRYDGNNQTLAVDNWLAVNGERKCKHHQPMDVGDPHAFWIRG